MTEREDRGPAKINIPYRPKYLELEDKQDREDLDKLLKRLYQKYSYKGGITIPVYKMQATIIKTFANTMIDENWECEELT